MYDKLASEETLKKTKESLLGKGYEVSLVSQKEEALTKIKEIIPEGSSITNGSSVTLEQIGFMDLLEKGEHKWNDWHRKITAENDQAKRTLLRKEATFSDFYLGSVHALTSEGEFVIGSNTASQLPSIVYSSQNLIFVVSTKKIVSNLSEAMDRLEKYVVPLEDTHMKEKYGSGTALNKIVIFKGESSYSSRKIHFILITEDLGF